MDKPFWRWMGKIPDIVLLSLCWYVCCIPIITIIPASCALFDAVSRNLMMDDKGCYKRFFRSFVRELKQGIPLTILWLIIGTIAFYGMQITMFAGLLQQHRRRQEEQQGEDGQQNGDYLHVPCFQVGSDG